MANIRQEKSGIGGYFKGVKSEFKKIVWPTKEETLKYTGVVIATSVIVSLIVYALDLIFASLLNLIV